MSRRVVTILAVALVVALAASYLVSRLLSNRTATAPATAITQIIMADKNLEIGTLLKASDLRIGEWKGAVPKGVATKKDPLVGRGVIANIYEGEPIMENRLAAPGAGGGLAATIPTGKRACAVRVNDVVGLGGFVGPGMRVDILISGIPPGAQGNTGSKVKTVLQNIEVLSAGTNIQKDAEGKPQTVTVVNLLVTPEQAEILSLASEARIQLVLRNPLDTQETKTPGSAMASLFNEPRPAAPASASSKPRTAAPKVKPAPAAPPPVEAIVIPVHLIEVTNGTRHEQFKFSPRPEEKK